MSRTAFFPGSFDPFTNGHLDLVKAAVQLADRVVIGIGIHPQRQPLFDAEARLEMLREVVAEFPDADRGRVTVLRYDGLLVDAARKAKADFVLRGIRDAVDVGAELRLASMNRDLAPGLQTVFVPAAPTNRHISATLVRQVAQLGGDISLFVPEPIARRFAKLRGAT